MKYIIANWKANKTLAESKAWIEILLDDLNGPNPVKSKLENDQLQIIVAAPFTFLIPLKEKIVKERNIVLASQDISDHEDGAYTGEVTGSMLRGVIQYALVGHSERVKYQKETYDQLESKVEQAIASGITPIYCMQNESKIIHNAQFIAYDPTEAIGTGSNKSLEDVVEFKKSLSMRENSVFLYGGSVSENNISQYEKSTEIDGYIVGTASLDPKQFFALLTRL